MVWYFSARFLSDWALPAIVSEHIYLAVYGTDTETSIWQSHITSVVLIFSVAENIEVEQNTEKSHLRISEYQEIFEACSAAAWFDQVA